MTVINIKSLTIAVCIDEALRKEADYVVSGIGDSELVFSHESSLPPRFHQQSDGSISPETPSDKADVPSSVTHEASRKKSSAKARRQRKRAEAKLAQPGRPRPSLSKKHPIPAVLSVKFNAAYLSAAKGAFVSLRQKCSSPRERSLQNVLDEGLRVFEWDGW